MDMTCAVLLSRSLTIADGKSCSGRRERFSQWFNRRTSGAGGRTGDILTCSPYKWANVGLKGFFLSSGVELSPCLECFLRAHVV